MKKPKIKNKFIFVVSMFSWLIIFFSEIMVVSDFITSYMPKTESVIGVFLGEKLTIVLTDIVSNCIAFLFLYLMYISPIICFFIVFYLSVASIFKKTNYFCDANLIPVFLSPIVIVFSILLCEIIL